MNFIIFYGILLASVIAVSRCSQCSVPNNNLRLDCFPQFGANQEGCLSRGCCWSPPKEKNSSSPGDGSADVPYCFYPLDFPNYQIISTTPTSKGQKVLLRKLTKSYLPKEISTLLLEVIHETNSRVRVRITDPNSPRFEVPIKLGSADSGEPQNPEYQVFMPGNGSFSLEIKRKSDGRSIFKTYGPLLYSDQFIQISSLMSTNHIYGIGEQNRPFQHNLTNGWSRLGLWARDNAIETNINLYGTHPFYIGMPSDGKAFGTYFFNSNAQEFGLQPAPLVTYRTIGGILDMFFFTGGSPEITVSQYLDLIGKPMVPPFWALGFHLCKYGYKDINEITTVFLRNVKAGIPIGTQWADIDYMDGYKDFTVNPTKFKGLGDFVRNLRHNYGTRFVVILDPGIYDMDTKTYEPYTEGLRMNVFVRECKSNKPLKGEVWPGETVYPDFSHPNITSYWTKQIQKFLSKVPVDGLWIDMNEPSNFVDGSTEGCPNHSSLDFPFFTPFIRDQSLIKKTICPSALHFGDVPHYNVHNLYGYSEAVTTNDALQTLKPKERPFILSRSTYSGSGKYTFHWTGDNSADWDNLAHSIRQILSFNMFGIPMTGADICGFIGNTTEELCIRWMQLGAFYPFMRNHNDLHSADQDPAFWSVKAQMIMKNYIYVRYSLLPYFHTLLAKAYLNGTTVFRPVGFEFFTDPKTHSIDLQFMLGSALLVTPVVTKGSTSVIGYFPEGVWYDFLTGDLIRAGSVGSFVTLDAPLDKINVALRGGHILPLLDPQMTIDELRKSNLTLYCAMSLNSTSSGEMYWDDGISVDSFSGNKFSHITFSADSNGLYVNPKKIFYDDLPTLSRIVIIGLQKNHVSEVTVNSIPVPFSFDPDSSLLFIENVKQSLDKNVVVNWS